MIIPAIRSTYYARANNNNNIINSLLQTNVHIHVKKKIYIIQSKKKKKRKLKQHTDKMLYAELI